MGLTNDSTSEKEITSEDSEQTHERGAAPFPVAGIGASAGGLEALRSFLENLPDTGIAYVVIQHLSPNHKSILPELLERKTSMTVHKVEDGMAIQPNNIYVIPPDTYLDIVDGHLTLSPRKNKEGIFLPIDFFFKNLAYIYQNKAIGILLSGTGSDGTEGFKDIKAEGGITFAQDDSAAFSNLLQKSKERYETFISENAEGVWCFELKEPVSIKEPVEQQISDFYKYGYVAECNMAIARMFGYKNCEKMNGAKMEDIFLKNELNEESLKTFIHSNYRLNDIETNTTKGNQRSYFLHNLVGIIENEHVIRIWGTQRDITVQKMTEMALAKMKNQLNFALAAGSVGTFLWDFSSNKITWTKVQESLYGLKEFSFKGTLKDWLHFIHPDDQADTEKAIEESIAQQKNLSIEFRIYWPDGTLHWILTRATTSFDNKGNPLEMSGVNIDISERKFKEQLIRENEERFRALVQSSFDVITVFNLDGTVTYQSESIERVLGYTRKERLGMNIFDQSIVHPEDREIETKLFQKCIDKPQEHFKSEFRMLHKDGSYRIMEVGCINLVNNSSIHGIIKNYRDITERRLIEKQKEEFIGIASHELKTPVTTIKGYAQILQSMLSEKGDTYSAELLTRMDHQIDRLTTLIKDLLDVTRITEGQLILKSEEFDLNELINEVANDLQITTKNHAILKELEEIKPLNADKERISQVLVNLLSNAIKYSPQADKIIIKTSATENAITVCVQDFGIGISNEMQKKLFKRFFRVTDGSVTTFPGLGLGLFIATEIIKNHRGRMWVESTPNEGSTFCFTIPFSS